MYTKMVSTGVTIGYVSTVLLLIGGSIAAYYYDKYANIVDNKDKKYTADEVTKAKTDKKNAGWATGIMFFLMALVGIISGFMHKKEGSAPASAVKFYYF